MTRVNGEVMQDSNTDDLIFDVPTLVHELSKCHDARSGRHHRHRHALRRGAGAQPAALAEARRRLRGRDRAGRRAAQSDRAGRLIEFLPFAGLREGEESAISSAPGRGRPSSGVWRTRRRRRDRPDRGHHDDRHLEGDAGHRGRQVADIDVGQHALAAMAARMSSFSATARARTSGLSRSVRTAVKLVRPSASSSGSSDQETRNRPRSGGGRTPRWWWPWRDRWRWRFSSSPVSSPTTASKICPCRSSCRRCPRRDRCGARCRARWRRRSPSRRTPRAAAFRSAVRFSALFCSRRPDGRAGRSSLIGDRARRRSIAHRPELCQFVAQAGHHVVHRPGRGRTVPRRPTKPWISELNSGWTALTPAAPSGGRRRHGPRRAGDRSLPCRPAPAAGPRQIVGASGETRGSWMRPRVQIVAAHPLHAPNGSRKPSPKAP